MPGNTKHKGTSSKPSARGKSTVKQYAASKLNKVDSSFHIKLKHVLGGVSLLSLLAAFEVISIPAANGIIDLFGFSEKLAGLTWIGVAMISGGIAIVLHMEEDNYKYRSGLK